MGRDAAKVRVTIYDDCNVDCEEVNLSQGMGDQIEWQSTGQAFTVEFEDSPFQLNRFDVPAGQSICSGPVAKTALFVTYHYAIRPPGSSSGGTDPDVNVKH
jgi:hypothetical protein